MVASFLLRWPCMSLRHPVCAGAVQIGIFVLHLCVVQEALGCLRPNLEPKATDFIPQMVATIQVCLPRTQESRGLPSTPQGCWADCALNIGACGMRNCSCGLASAHMPFMSLLRCHILSCAAHHRQWARVRGGRGCLL